MVRLILLFVFALLSFVSAAIVPESKLLRSPELDLLQTHDASAHDFLEIEAEDCHKSDEDE